MALDADLEAVRHWATDQPLTFPMLIDREMVLAELLGIVNVPASVWVEDGVIVRPPDTAMGDDRYRAFAHIDSAVHHDHLRRWVRDGVRDLDDEQVREYQELPSTDTQLARLHRRVGLALRDRGETVAAMAHLHTAEELAPNDWTIRRGNMPLEGDDPFGDKFFAFVGEWIDNGSPGFRLRTGRED